MPVELRLDGPATLSDRLQECVICTHEAGKSEFTVGALGQQNPVGLPALMNGPASWVGGGNERREKFQAASFRSGQFGEGTLAEIGQ